MDSDRAAELRFRRLYDEYGGLIFAYFKRRTDDPRDCTADTFLVAWRRLETVPEGDAALRWLYGVAHKVLLNHWRSQRRFTRLRRKLAEQGRVPAQSPETIVVDRTEVAALRAAFHRLPKNDQELLRLATWEELPHAAIGEVMGCSAHAVDQRIYRAIRRLAREVERSGHRLSAGTAAAAEPGGRVT